MSQASSVNPQVADALRLVREATITPEVIEASGSGKAFQSVSQSAAMAVQDATQNLRNVSTISSTAIGVAMAQYLSTGDEKYKKVLDEAKTMMSQAATDFRDIGNYAAFIVNSFPSGSQVATPSGPSGPASAKSDQIPPNQPA